jgi:hypothetical protein
MGMNTQTDSRVAKPSRFTAARLLLTAGILSTLSVLTGCGSGGTPLQPVPLATDVVKSGPITITTGGTYSGNWVSSDPSVPAILVTTDQPVIIQNSTVSGPGDLIQLAGKSVADLTVRNVTGTGVDPKVAGQARGAFVDAFSFKSLVVQNCTMTGVATGIYGGYGTAQTVKITNNQGSGLEDRASDGKGGFQTLRPRLGHFIQLGKLSAPNGAEIAWNELKQTIGQTSTEDPINIYLSQGGNGRPIYVHDNYVEGNSSPAKATYSGNGIMTDGDATGNTSWVLIQANQVVHTAGSGIAIASGHDVTVQANRVVSCGKDSEGNTYTQYGAAAVGVWNYYKAPNFYNNSITSTAGGLVAVNQKGAPVVDDTNAVTIDSTDTIANNSFTDPCIGAGGVLNLSAEDQERTYWATKLKTNTILLGDQH